ncbi:MULTISPECIES: DMT family transporter [Variovorax]|uniref:DMT family transporter n=1 Tax=Variovorax TaxID=34072 RepID=UPI000FBC70BA|nr:DMT family transporter [Variovorax boronicumulans]GER09630.1 EamA/RhaT family transporter [Variovorax boronicumulans]GER15140.1 EamA/RhaT family transporter [Variovorax boronicumulans]
MTTTNNNTTVAPSPSPAPAALAPKAWLVDLVLLGALWGASFLFMRIGAAEFGALPTAAVRVVIAALFLLPIALLRGQGPSIAKHWKASLTVGIFNSGMPFALFCFALLTINTGLAAVLNATTPMFGALVAWAWFRERPNGSRLVGLVIGFAGVAMLASRSAGLHAGASNHAALWAVLACLAACLCYGISASATRRHLSGVPALTTATGSQIGASLFLALPAIWLWPAQMPSLRAWLALLALGIACTGVAYILFFRLIERAGPARALTVTFLVPVFALFYGAVFLGEQITQWMLICAFVIVCGVALSTGIVKLPSLRKAAG